MDKQDFKDLITVWEAMEKVNDLVMELTDGYEIQGKKLEGIYKLYGVIHNNSRYSENDEETESKFDSILFNKNYSILEKYDLLVPLD